MCGICGRYNYNDPSPVSRAELKRMNDLIVHRGPDDEGYYVSNNIGLAMRRLSIIDLSGGHQPMTNEDGSIWVVLNGEIYNFQSLREDLSRRGHKFKTKSDTEVIAHLYEEKGIDFAKELRGMFAISLWDSNKKRFILARDRIGKKPLFYSLNDNFIAFASELRSILSVPGISKEVDLTAIDAYLSLQYIPSPLSIFKSIRKLKPASMLVFENGKSEISEYWDLPLKEEKLDYLSIEETKERLYSELFEATKIRMISDVPLGAFLSGGVDSSVIVALMSKISSKPVKTFSIGFKEDKFSELKYAKEVADMYSTDHTEFIVEAEMIDILPKIVWHYCEPYADPSALPSYYVSRETRREVTVALNGDGGDECFGGYLRYIAMRLAGYMDLMPNIVKKSALMAANMMPDKNAPFGIAWRGKKFLQVTLSGSFSSTYLSTIAFFRTKEKNELLSDEFKNAVGKDLNYAEGYIAGVLKNVGGQDQINKFMYADLHSYLPECLMTKMDIASMANSLEARSPFLDHKVMEFAFRLPGNLKLRGLNKTKWILKETFKDMLPKTICARGKQGFGIPMGQWFRGALKDYWFSICLSEKALNRGYFKKEVLFKIWDEHQKGKRDHGYHMWALLMLELWHNAYLDDFKL
ncbi:MAG: asparagine synthase (glutamine-hydrolyzing) [Elusimicrobiales bacterium]|nr:asparagine synthase (glutamine-hydrolyzing) [Elusimicrobiales bacterium]